MCIALNETKDKGIRFQILFFFGFIILSLVMDFVHFSSSFGSYVSELYYMWKTNLYTWCNNHTSRGVCGLDKSIKAGQTNPKNGWIGLTENMVFKNENPLKTLCFG